MTGHVWVDAWQVQCCGDAFAVGDEVTWRLTHEVDEQWLGLRLGPQLAADVLFAEDHHDVAGDCRPYAGRITAIRRVETVYRASAADPRGMEPVAGSSELTDVASADGDESGSSARQLDGYLVEIRQLHALPRVGEVV